MPPRIVSPRRGRRRAAGPRLEALEGRALLATLTVSSLADSGPGTLRDAITRANADAAADVIGFAPGLAGAIALEGALPDLSTDLSIDGPGAASLAVTRDPAAATAFRIFTVDRGATVTLSNLAIKGGGGTYPTASPGVQHGGGVSNAGTLTIQSCRVEGNAISQSTIGSGGPGTGSASGGGIYNVGALTLLDSTVAGNQANLSYPLITEFNEGVGGGLHNAATGTATVERSTFTGNGAGMNGGGIANDGTLSLINVTIAGNATSSNFHFPSAGGGLYNSTGAVARVVASTIASNSAFNTAAGIANFGTLVLVDDIVATNRTSFGTASDILGNVADGSVYNLLGSSMGMTGVTDGVLGNQVGTPDAPLDPRLGPLADNGGPTQTMAILNGSPAIDAGLTLPFVTTDQRGIARPQGRAPEIGAFEGVGLVPAGPRVTSLARLGAHVQPTQVVLTFDQPLAPGPAGNVGNYTLTTAGRDGRFGTRDDQRIRLRSASYDAATGTVTIRPARLLALRGRYQVQVNGVPPGGLTGRNGTPLDGAGNGSPGTNYVKTFGIEAYVPPPKPTRAARHGKS